MPRKDSLKSCQICAFYGNPKECEIAKNNSNPDNPKKEFFGICHDYEPYYAPEFDMRLILNILNERFIFKCPTDTRKLLLYEEGVYVPAETKVHELIEEKYAEETKKHGVEETIAHLQRANYIDRSKINQYINKIPIKNGLFNFLTREIELFDPEHIFTYKLNVDYNPEAKCPKWLEFIKEIVAEEDIPLLQEIMGYCLLPAMPFHKMFWFYGTVRNGKGVVIRTLEDILGKDGCGHLNLAEFRESRRFSLCQLYGKLINVSSEPPLSKYGLPTTILKMVTGQDRISAELKNKNERLDFDNFSKLLVLGNHFPKVEDNSLGWWDRVIVLNFPNSFEGEQCVTDIEKRWIPEETSGIFNWMLEGIYRIYENNGFSSSKTTEEIKTEFMRVSDPFNAWILENCQKIAHTYLTREEALTDCENYCQEIGADILNRKAFYEKMRNEPQVRDVKKKIAGKSVRVFEGITLTTDESIAQTSLDGAVGAIGAVPTIPETLDNHNYIESKKRASPAPSAPIDIDSLFPEGQYPVCFSCHEPIIQLEFLTNIDGKPIHKSCKNQIEAQKRKTE